MSMRNRVDEFLHGSQPYTTEQQEALGNRNKLAKYAATLGGGALLFAGAAVIGVQHGHELLEATTVTLDVVSGGLAFGAGYMARAAVQAHVEVVSASTAQAEL